MKSFFQNRWWVVIACFLGLSVGSGTINVFTFAVFLKPVSGELGVSRGMFSSALLLTNIMNALATPLLGYCLDRWGFRAVMLPSLALFACSVSAFSTMQPAALATAYILFGLAGFFSAAQSTVPYALVISKWFDRDRGLALGIAMAGVGLGVVVIPQAAAIVILTEGWRVAYIEVGAAILLLGFLPVALVFRDPPEKMPVNGFIGQSSKSDASGLTAVEAVTGSWRFWALTGAFFIGVVSTHGTLVHVVALFADRGASAQGASMALSLSGLGMIFGRIISGYITDHIHARYVAIGFFMVSMLGIVLWQSQLPSLVPYLAVLLVGMGVGAQVGLQAFLASRYFGLKAYGTIYGLMFGFYLAGAGFGPFASGLSFDLWQSYGPAFTTFAVGLVLASVLLLPLGPYQFGPLKLKATPTNN